MGDTINTINDLDALEIARSFECDISELKKCIEVRKNDFTMISQNIRSVYKNFDDFQLILSNLEFEADVITLTECRLDQNKPIPQITNYHSYFTKTQLNQNSGVVVYIKSNLKHKVSEIKLAQANCLQLEILNNTILCIYRSPSYINADDFIDSLSTHLDSLNSSKSIIIAGDININITIKSIEPPYELKDRINYLNMLAVYGILPGHTIPTREKNCLDHFMMKMNKTKFHATIAVLHTSTTDHFTTFLSISKIKNHQLASKTRTIVNYEAAALDLETKNLTELLYCDDPDAVINGLVYSLKEIIKNNTVITTIPKKNRNIKPWITPGILRCIRNRNKLQKKVKDDPYNELNKIIYIRYRNYCNNLIKKLKRQYERELLNKSINNNKKLWKNIKNITFTSMSNNNNNIDLLNVMPSPAASADYVNHFFANIGRQLAQQVQLSQEELNDYLRNLPTQSNSFVLLDTDQDEVSSTLLSLKTSSAPGWDNIPTIFLKRARLQIVPILTHFINLCFHKGTFPSLFKQAIITPVHKSGDRDSVTNYRPISVLPAISKIMEKLLNSRLLNYLNRYNILSPSQYGFRQGRSTEDAVSALSSLVVEKLDSHKKCMAVFLDLQKAFDTVSIPILLRKLEAIGMKGTPLNLLKDYLSNRQQRVKLDSFISGDSEVTYGVPQGSVLGPTLFLIYINDLCDMKIKNAQILSYADDTAVVFSADSWENVRKQAESGLKQINKWLSNNLLSLNTTKTNYICFSIYNNTQPPKDFSIKIHKCNTSPNVKTCSCPEIQKVDQVKYLGVYVDQRLSWYPQLEYVSSRLRKLIWIFRMLRYVVPRMVDNQTSSEKGLLIKIYYSLVQSILIYCISIWGGAAKTRFIEVERAQRRLIKTMCFQNLGFSTERLYQNTGILSVRKLYIMQAVLRKHLSLPYNPDIKNRRRHDIVVRAPRSNTAFAKRQYTKRSGHLYNTANKVLGIYDKVFFECRRLLKIWLLPKSYDDTEALLE